MCIFKSLVRNEQNSNDGEKHDKKNQPDEIMPNNRNGYNIQSVCGRLIVHWRRRQQVLSVRGQRITRIHAPAASRSAPPNRSSLASIIPPPPQRTSHHSPAITAQYNNIVIVIPYTMNFTSYTYTDVHNGRETKTPPNLNRLQAQCRE